MEQATTVTAAYQKTHGRQSQPAPGLLTPLPWELSRAVFLEYFGLLHCLRYSGQHNIPPVGPMILAPNHVSYYDPPLVAAGVPHRVRFMAWNMLFKVPGLAQFITSYGAFPVKSKSADKGAIEASLRILRAGECLMLFPEGQRSHDGSLMELEQGVARLALQTGAAIVPVTIVGGFEAWPRHHLVPTLCRPVTVKFHPSFRVSKHDFTDIKAAVEYVNGRLAAVMNLRLRAAKRAGRHQQSR